MGVVRNNAESEVLRWPGGGCSVAVPLGPFPEALTAYMVDSDTSFVGERSRSRNHVVCLAETSPTKLVSVVKNYSGAEEFRE